MKFIIAFLIFFASLDIAHGQGWYKQNSGTAADLNQVYFFTKDSGWAVGSGVWYRTTNGGQVWESRPSPSGFAVGHMLDFNTAYAFRGKYVIHTTDQGVTWIDTGNTNFNTYIGNLYALDKDTILALEAYYSRSTDGGKTWTRTDDFPAGVNDQGSHDIHFVNSQRGYIVGRVFNCAPKRTSGISETTDGAKTWHSLCTQNKLKPPIEALWGVFAKDDFIIGVGDWGTIIRSTDRGQNWDTVPYKYPLAGVNTAVTFPTVTTGYITGGGGIILKSTDKGTNWIKQNSGVGYYLRDVNFIDSLSGWVVGESGIILHTINGGQSWVRQQLPIDTLNPQIYPVPSVGNATLGITLANRQHISISIIDETGNTVLEIGKNVLYEPGVHFIPLDVSSLPAGAYWVRIQSELYDRVVKGIKIVP